VPKYPQIYPIICGVLKPRFKTALSSRNSTPKVDFFSHRILGLAPDKEGPAVMLVATSGLRIPIDGFVETFGIMFLLALNHAPPSITIMTYPLPVFARLSLAPGI
jgi:hypothetical protein